MARGCADLLDPPSRQPGWNGVRCGSDAEPALHPLNQLPQRETLRQRSSRLLLLRPPGRCRSRRLGLGLGLLVAFNIDVIVPALERLFNASFLPRDIYLISRMPSQPLAADIVPVVLMALLLAFAATLYPSWRASRVRPAEALRHE